MIAKALASDADLVMIDLEDAVAPTRKPRHVQPWPRRYGRGTGKGGHVPSA